MNISKALRAATERMIVKMAWYIVRLFKLSS